MLPGSLGRFPVPSGPEGAHACSRLVASPGHTQGLSSWPECSLHGGLSGPESLSFHTFPLHLLTASISSSLSLPAFPSCVPQCSLSTPREALSVGLSRLDRGAAVLVTSGPSCLPGRADPAGAFAGRTGRGGGGPLPAQPGARSPRHQAEERAGEWGCFPDGAPPLGEPTSGSGWGAGAHSGAGGPCLGLNAQWGSPRRPSSYCLRLSPRPVNRALP